MVIYVRDCIPLVSLLFTGLLIFHTVALKITTKAAVFLPIAFQPSLPRKFPRNSCENSSFFRDFVPLNPAKFDFFFRDQSEALYLRK